MKLDEELELLRKKIVLIITCSLLADIFIFSFPFILQINRDVGVESALFKISIYSILNLVFVTLTFLLKSKKNLFFIFMLSIVISLKSVLFFLMERVFKTFSSEPKEESQVLDITCHLCSLCIKAIIVFCFYKLYDIARTCEFRANECLSNPNLDSTNLSSNDNLVSAPNEECIKQPNPRNHQSYYLLNDESFNSRQLNTPEDPS